MTNQVREVHFEKAAAFVDYFMPTTKLWRTLPWLFRGHSREEYRLEPSIERAAAGTASWESWLYPPQRARIEKHTRAPTPHYAYFAEVNVVIDFVRALNARGLAPPFGHEFVRDVLQIEHSQSVTESVQLIGRADERMPFVALAQHYGLPTRLLDWSWNPLTAVYFAVCQAVGRSEGNVCVWALNSDTVALSDSASLVSLPNVGNANMQSQSGAFTRVDDAMLFERGTPELRLLDRALAGSTADHVFVKATMPASQAALAWERVNLLGVGAHTLFPGHAGVAQAIRERQQVIEVLGRGVPELR